MKRSPTLPKTRALEKELQERLVGFVLLNLLVTEQQEGEFLLSAMIEGKILDEIEGKELQALREKIWGKKKVRLSRLPGGAQRIEFETVKKPEEAEGDESRAELLIKALEYLKRSNMFYLPASEASFGEEIFREVIDTVRLQSKYKSDPGALSAEIARRHGSMRNKTTTEETDCH